MIKRLVPNYDKIDYKCLDFFKEKIINFRNTKYIDNIHSFGHNCFLWEDGGIETDPSKYKTFSILITNWERQFYLPYIFNQYYFQDYPHELLEFIVVDDDSEDKQEILNIVKEQVRLYPSFKIRFFQHHKNFLNNPMFRLNVGIRNSKNDIVIFNETDNIPIHDSFLKGVCYSHNLGQNIRCSPLVLDFNSQSIEINESLTKKEAVENVFLSYSAFIRLTYVSCISLNTNLFNDDLLLGEIQTGWGGGETYMTNKFFGHGGLIHINFNAICGVLQNFPFRLKDSIAEKNKYHFENQFKIERPQELWGTSDYLEEIEL